MYSEFASSCDHQLHDGKTCQKSFFNVLTRGLCIYLQFYFEFRDRGNFALQMSFNNCNCTLPPNWETSVVEAPEHSQVVSTTWPLVGTTCPVGTEYTISPSIAKSTCYRSKISAANRQFSACKELLLLLLPILCRAASSAALSHTGGFRVGGGVHDSYTFQC